MVAMETRRTFKCKVANHDEVAPVLKHYGTVASKLWNVARYYTEERWDEDGEIPSYSELCRELKNHDLYGELPNHTAQQVFKELSEAFRSWYQKRKNDDAKARPPKYRKHGDTWPLSTVTWKQFHLKVHEDDNLIRLSKGRNNRTKEQRYIWLKIETPPQADLSQVKEVKLVHRDGKWVAHINCIVEIETGEPGNGVAGIDLGITNLAAVAYPGDENHLYKANTLKEDEYYFLKKVARCETGSNKSEKLHRTRTKRRNHFLHALTKKIVEDSKERGVGTIAVGDLSSIREDDDGETRNWGKHGNLDLHSWPFNRFVQLLSYKAEAEGIKVIEVDESYSSRECSVCGKRRKKNRIHRGLYRCSNCGTEMNADTNGARNIREKGIEKVTETREGIGNEPPGTATGETPIHLQRWNREGTFQKVLA